MLRRFEEEKLIKAEPHQITRVVIQMLGTKPMNPKIEQSEVSQNAIEKLCREGAVRTGEIARSQELAEDSVRKLFAHSPFLQSEEGEGA
jgi:hypothetical protein